MKIITPYEAERESIGMVIRLKQYPIENCIEEYRDLVNGYFIKYYNDILTNPFTSFPNVIDIEKMLSCIRDESDFQTDDMWFWGGCLFNSVDQLRNSGWQISFSYDNQIAKMVIDYDKGRNQYDVR
jgi:hypothetical protein